MALIKAFVCQIFLFGIYKLFLEQVVEEHLVPDELIRNCLCGFICLLCFGIQLYTDSAADDDGAEAEDDPKVKSESRATGAKESARTSEDISVAHGSSINVSTIQERCRKSTKDEVANSKERDSTISPSKPAIARTNRETYSTDSYKVTSSTNRTDGTEKPIASTSTAENVKETVPVRFETADNVHEEDEDSLEIDHLDAEETDKEIKQLRTVEFQEAVVKPEDIEVVESEPLVYNGISDSSTQVLDKATIRLKIDESTTEIQNVPVSESSDRNDISSVQDKDILLKIDKYTVDVLAEPAVESLDTNDISTLQDSDQVTILTKIDQSTEGSHNETVVECLNGVNDISSTQVLDKVATFLEVDEPAAEIDNESAVKDLNNADTMPSIATEGVGMEKEDMAGKGQEVSLTTESIEFAKATSEQLSATKIDKTVPSIKPLNGTENVKKYNAEASTLVNGKISSSLEKPSSSIKTDKLAIADEVYFPTVTIDVSFIYACH